MWGGISGQFLTCLIRLSTGLEQNVQWVTFMFTTRQSFTVPFEAQKWPQCHWRFPVQRIHLSSVPVQRIHECKSKSKNPDIQCRSVCCQAVSEETRKFHCLITPLSPILILTLVCNWSDPNALTPSPRERRRQNTGIDQWNPFPPNKSATPGCTKLAASRSWQ